MSGRITLHEEIAAPPLNLTDVVTPDTADLQARRKAMALRAREWAQRADERSA